MFTKFSRIIVPTICCFCFITNLHAQTTKGWGLIGSTYLNSPFGNYIVDIGVVRTWGFGKYITLGAGAKYSYAQTENLNKDWYSGSLIIVSSSLESVSCLYDIDGIWLSMFCLI